MDFTVPPSRTKRLPPAPRRWKLDLDSRLGEDRYALAWFPDGRGVIHIAASAWIRVDADTALLEDLDRAMRRAQSHPTIWVHREIRGASAAPRILLARIVGEVATLAMDLACAGPADREDLIGRYRALREQLDSLRAEVDQADVMLDTTGVWLTDVGVDILA